MNITFTFYHEKCIPNMLFKKAAGRYTNTSERLASKIIISF